MRAFRVVPGMTVVLVSLVAVAVAGCGPFSSSSSTAASASSAATPAGQSASSGASAPAVSSSATSSSGNVQNLVATAAVKGELLAAFAASHNIPVSDVASIAPGSVYYAYDPATQTYWAQATFTPVSTDPPSVTVGFQDGGQGGYFKRSGSGPWQSESMGEPAVCTEWRYFPQAVLAAWARPAPGAGVC